MKTETIVMCVVALILGMLLAHMLKGVCGCKNVVEGTGDAGDEAPSSPPPSPPPCQLSASCAPERWNENAWGDWARSGVYKTEFGAWRLPCNNASANGAKCDSNIHPDQCTTEYGPQYMCSSDNNKCFCAIYDVCKRPNDCPQGLRVNQFCLDDPVRPTSPPYCINKNDPYLNTPFIHDGIMTDDDTDW